MGVGLGDQAGALETGARRRGRDIERSPGATVDAQRRHARSRTEEKAIVCFAPSCVEGARGTFVFAALELATKDRAALKLARAMEVAFKEALASVELHGHRE